MACEISSKKSGAQPSEAERVKYKRLEGGKQETVNHGMNKELKRHEESKVSGVMNKKRDNPV